MVRFILSVVLSFLFLDVSLHAATVSRTEIASDMIWLLETRSSLDELSSTGKIYQTLARNYLRELSNFTQKYQASLAVFGLRPTIDRTLEYRLHIQDYTLSCEIAALKIVLDTLGLRFSEKDIFSWIPIYNAPYSGWIWGDPDIEFVWYYTGGQNKKTGYGIYEKPLANFSKLYGYKTEILNQYSYSGSFDKRTHIKLLLKKLSLENTHVLLWWDWCTTPSQDDGIVQNGWKWIMDLFPLPARNHCDRKSQDRIFGWKTHSGKEVSWLSGEHAFVLLGYVWPLHAPTHIIVWDTYTWRHVYGYNEWMRKWWLVENRSLVIYE